MCITAGITYAFLVVVLSAIASSIVSAYLKYLEMRLFRFPIIMTVLALFEFLYTLLLQFVTVIDTRVV